LLLKDLLKPLRPSEAQPLDTVDTQMRPAGESDAPKSGKAKLLGRWGRKHLFTIFVLLPTVLATIYYTLFAADQYVSESRFVIKAQGKQQPQISTLANLIQTTGLSPGLEQTNEILAYIRSRNALEHLARKIDVRAAYKKPSIDWVARYPFAWREDRFENLYRYYNGMVEARIDSETSLAVLTVRAFTPEDAQNINLHLLELSEKLVNRLNEKARVNAISEAEKRVVEAEGRVRNARTSLGAYRNQEQLLDPARQAAAVLEVTTRLIAQQAALQAQLDTLVRSAPRNPGIPALRRQITAIQAEVGAQTGRAVGGRAAIASKLGEYEKRAMEQEFAAQTLTAANAALEQARTEAQRQQFYLERVVEPNRADLARLPNRFLQVLTIAVGGLFLYLIAWMLIVGILEHSPDT
jgi:capsular polysaccharide transport system permease protein